MILFLYLLALIPLMVGGFFWVTNKSVNWIEWLSGAAAAVLVSGIMHLVAVTGQTIDVETWSGQITKATFYPRWVEEYQQMHTRQVASGRDSEGRTTYTTETYYTTEHRTHHEHWEAASNIGTEYEISQSDFNSMRQTFKDYTVEKPYKSGFDSGDPHIYVSYNRSGYEHYPITDKRVWSNRVKAAPSTFTFQEVPEDAKVYPWPENENPWMSNRVLGIGVGVTQIEWDRMNARLGPSKRVNVIIVGFGSDTSLVELQKAKWLGGKKNDLVLVVCSKNGKVFHSDVFGWSDSELAKSNLRTILLTQKIDNTIIPKIEAEIRKNYIIKDWSQFDYLTIEPPTWSYFVTLGLMIVTQTGFWIWAHKNEFDKDSGFRNAYGYRRRRW